MDSDPLPVWLSLTLVLVLVFLNGFFVAAEFAMVKVRGSRMDALAEAGNRQAKFAQNILKNMNAYLSACQLGITLTSLGLGWLGEPAIAKLIAPMLSSIGIPTMGIHTIAFIIGFTLITIFHITIGEQYPKTYAIRQSEQVTLWAAIPLVIFYKMMYPFIIFVNGISNWLLRKSGIEPEGDHEQAHTGEELRVLAQESHRNGLIDNTELVLVDNVLDFSETFAREIMIPRTEMVCMYTDQTYEENKHLAISETHTRYPVCDTDKDNIIGYVHIKDMMRATGDQEDIRHIIRPLMAAPESMPISLLLRKMQKNQTEIVLLIDEYGGTSGLVTIEDIIEEIVGEINDEFDDGREGIEKKDESTYSIDGMLLIEEINDHFDLDIISDNYDTIGGWVYGQVEMPPRKYQKVVYQQYEFIIDEVTHMRISRLTVRKLALPEQVQEESRKEVS